MGLRQYAEKLGLGVAGLFALGGGEAVAAPKQKPDMVEPTAYRAISNEDLNHLQNKINRSIEDLNKLASDLKHKLSNRLTDDYSDGFSYRELFDYIDLLTIELPKNGNISGDAQTIFNNIAKLNEIIQSALQPIKSSRPLRSGEAATSMTVDSVLENSPSNDETLRDAVKSLKVAQRILNNFRRVVLETQTKRKP